MNPPMKSKITLKITREDLVTSMLAVAVVIKAADRDNIPNSKVKKAYNALARGLVEHDAKYEKGGQDAKIKTGDKNPET